MLACGAPASLDVVPSEPRAVAVGPRCVAPERLEATVRVPFGFYSVPQARFPELAQAGVTMVGPYYGEPPGVELLDAASAAGLKVVYPIGFASFRSEDEGKSVLVAQVERVRDHDAVGAWYVSPEEVRPWVADELAYLDWVRATVREHDVRGRPLLGYQPNHRRRAELATVSAAFDVVTRGQYANFVGAQERRGWVRVGAETIVAASQPNQQPWAVLEMFEQPNDEDLGDVRTWVRHDVYASLVSGARGVLVFSGWPRAGFPAYAAYLEGYLDVVHELNGPSALATPLMQGVPSSQVGVFVEAGPTTVDASPSDRPHTVPSIATREVLVGETTWLYVVSSAEVDVVVRVEAPCALESVSGPAVEDGRLALPPLSVAVLRTVLPGEPPGSSFSVDT